MSTVRPQEFTNYTVLENKQVRTGGLVSKKYMAGVFTWMFLALGISTLFAIVFAGNSDLIHYLVDTIKGKKYITPLGIGVVIAPLILAMIMRFGATKFSPAILKVLFATYAAVNGIAFSIILLSVSTGTVIGCFTAASLMFGVMALMGYTTDKDLTSFGSILTMGLVGIMVAIMVNWFLHSGMLDYIISLVGVAVFTGLTAYDVQKLKRIGAGLEFENISAGDTKKLVLFGGFTLYLDFVLLFLMLIRLFEGRRD